MMTVQPILIYDGDCPMCQRWVRFLSRLGLTRGITVTPWQESNLDDPRLDERIRSEILLTRPDTRETVGGIDVLVALFEAQPRYQWLGRLLEFPPVMTFSRSLYQTIALNRRILAPPFMTRLECTCDPPDSPDARWHLYSLLLFFSLLGVLAFSAGIAVSFHQGYVYILSRLFAAMTVGWIVAYLGLAVILRRRFGEYVQQSLVIMAVGSCWLFIAAILLLVFRNLTPESNATLIAPLPLMTIAALNIHTLIMMISTFRRSHALVFPHGLPWLWLALYFTGYIFTLNALIKHAV